MNLITLWIFALAYVLVMLSVFAAICMALAYFLGGI